MDPMESCLAFVLATGPQLRLLVLSLLLLLLSIAPILTEEAALEQQQFPSTRRMMVRE
jgi:hypothetical protein